MPSSAPASVASAHGTPISQAIGAKTQPVARCSVKGASKICTAPSTTLPSATSDTSTSTIAPTLATSRKPSKVPRLIASITPSYFKASAMSPPVAAPSSGIMMRATVAAPTTLMTEATSTWPKAASMTSDRMAA